MTWRRAASPHRIFSWSDGLKVWAGSAIAIASAAGIVCGEVIDWAAQSTADAARDRSVIIFDGKSPNSEMHPPFSSSNPFAAARIEDETENDDEDARFVFVVFVSFVVPLFCQASGFVEAVNAR